MGNKYISDIHHPPRGLSPCRCCNYVALACVRAPNYVALNKMSQRATLRSECVQTHTPKSSLYIQSHSDEQKIIQSLKIGKLEQTQSGGS